MNPRSAIQKGKELENWIADQIVAKGIDPKAHRTSGSGNGNREKGDITTSMMILGQNAGIECKNHATIHIPEWWRQTKKLESLGREPVLAFKLPGESYDDAKVVIYLETFLELVKRANAFQGVMPTNEDPKGDRELKWALERLKSAISAVIKLVG